MRRISGLSVVAFGRTFYCAAGTLVFFGRRGRTIRHRHLHRPAGPHDALLQIRLDRLVLRRSALSECGSM